MNKKAYTPPQTQTFNVEVQAPLLQLSISNKEISSEHAGFVKSDRSSRSSYNVWDDDWNN